MHKYFCEILPGVQIFIYNTIHNEENYHSIQG